jgi:hypothetical protein
MAEVDRVIIPVIIGIALAGIDRAPGKAGAAGKEGGGGGWTETVQ